jgi:hypothetical protein
VELNRERQGISSMSRPEPRASRIHGPATKIATEKRDVLPMQITCPRHAIIETISLDSSICNQGPEPAIEI